MPNFQTADGLTLHFTDEGAGGGAPILCLAGLTRNGRDFDFFAEALDRPRRILRLDSRGRGGSDHDPNWANYNAKVEAEDALALLDHLKIDQVVVVGSSRGGILGMMMAALRPGVLAGLVLNDVGPEVDMEGLKRILGYLGQIPPFTDLDQAAAAIAAMSAATFPGKDIAYFKAIAERTYLATDDGLALPYDAKIRDATAAQIDAMEINAPDLWPLYRAACAAPMLVLRGEHSDILSLATLGLMRSANPELISVTVPGVGHIPRLDEPEALTAIRALLDGLNDG